MQRSNRRFRGWPLGTVPPGIRQPPALAHCPSHPPSHRLLGWKRMLVVTSPWGQPGCPLTTSGHPPSSGSSLAQVSAVIRLAMKRWLVGGVGARGPGVTAMVAPGPRGAGQGVGGTSRVVATCSGGSSVSSSMLSSRTWAVLRGWRSFCTAAGTWRCQHWLPCCHPPELSPCVPSHPSHRPCSCRPAGTS